MNLLVLMYHRASAGKHGNSPEKLDAHFAHLARNYNCVRPGDPLRDDLLNVCLSFDDAYFDFYAIVAPLLRKYGLTALLAVSPGLIAEQAPDDTSARLALSIDDAYRYPERGGFCTWSELRELVAGGNIAIAAHGCIHVSLAAPGVDLEDEIVLPRALLTARLGVPVSSFVFPFGRFSKEALKKVRTHYRYAFRIGGAMNDHWKHRVLYRVDADSMTDAASLTTAKRLALYRCRFFWNRLRGR